MPFSPFPPFSHSGAPFSHRFHTVFTPFSQFAQILGSGLHFSRTPADESAPHHCRRMPWSGFRTHLLRLTKVPPITKFTTLQSNAYACVNWPTLQADTLSWAPRIHAGTDHGRNVATNYDGASKLTCQSWCVSKLVNVRRLTEQSLQQLSYCTSLPPAGRPLHESSYVRCDAYLIRPLRASWLQC